MMSLNVNSEGQSQTDWCVWPLFNSNGGVAYRPTHL